MKNLLFLLPAEYYNIGDVILDTNTSGANMQGSCSTVLHDVSANKKRGFVCLFSACIILYSYLIMLGLEWMLFHHVAILVRSLFMCTFYRVEMEEVVRYTVVK